MSQLTSSGGLLLIEDKKVRDAMLTYQQGLEACKFQYAEMTAYFHVVEKSQKQLLNLRLGKRAFEFIEEDFRRILLPLSDYEALVPDGQYIIAGDPARFGAYYGDVLFYRTTLNNTILFLEEQRRLGDSLARLIRDTYGID